ncbi:hypothetical protein Salat_0884000 [Sesamum alatum]|uniref:RNase H type-1 domain-containing protein n=1 Tax=Sesamum alatum TaxID=300844 RepID=A0AAE1YJ28_9LAMI|nr:hypothetical protein Salat_0884000 [Sesamum alatum]
MEGSNDDPLRLIRKMQTSYSAFLEANESMEAPIVDSSKHNWEPPPHGIVKVNFDGVVCSSGRGVGIGVVARHHLGTCVDWIATSVSTVHNPEQAEALAARSVAEMIQRNSWHRILLEGDCLTMINRLRAPVRDDSYVSPILVDTTNILQSTHSWEVRHIRRSGNRVAHLLAQEAKLQSNCNLILSEDVRAAIQVDSNSYE